MKQVCLHCLREAPVGNLWCQEVVCSIDDKPVILEYGESIGDAVVVRLVNLLRASAVYEAWRSGEQVLLKVAHNTYEEKLKQEAIFLMQLQDRNVEHPSLPALLPAYGQADVQDHPYGKTVVNEQTIYYSVFEYVAGETLHDMLQRDPQPWYTHAGWLVLTLADALVILHRFERLHLCLSPDEILIRLDRDDIPRPFILDLGAVTPPDRISQAWRRRFVSPAYIAPELIGLEGGRVGAFTDVYGLGLTLYEMLAGHPAFSYRLRTDASIYQDVLHTDAQPVNRPDLKNLPQIAERAISKDYRRRQPTLLEFAQELQANLPNVPQEAKERRVNWRVIGIVIVGALAVSTLLAMAVAFGELITR